MQLVKKWDTEDMAQLLFPADKAKKTHHAERSSTYQASDQQTSSDQYKLLFVVVASLQLNQCPIILNHI